MRQRCPQCNNQVMQKSEGGTVLRLRGKILFKGGSCYAQCYWCKTVLEVPMQLGPQPRAVKRLQRFVLGGKG